MTDEQRKRTHEILYSTQSREELAKRIVALEDENAKLREQVTQLQDDWESEHDYADQMEANEKKAVGENAKLRELIQDYDECLDTALYLAGEAGYPCMPDEHLFKSLRPRMRELGVGE